MSGQRRLDQVRVIKTNEYFSKLELEEIMRNIKNRNDEEVQVSEQQVSTLSEQGIDTQNVDTSGEKEPEQLEVENGSTQGKK